MYQTHQLNECYETGCLDMDEIPGNYHMTIKIKVLPFRVLLPNKNMKNPKMVKSH